MKPEDAGKTAQERLNAVWARTGFDPKKPRNNPVSMVKNGEHILVSPSAVQFRLSKGWTLCD